MHRLITIAALRTLRAQWSGEGLAFIPTMGNLHAGHLALVEKAHQRAVHMLVSVFVNPLQFGPKEDYRHYPRTEEQDCEKLAHMGVDAVFLPTVGEMYPAGNDAITRVDVPGLSNILCGAMRPGHFSGVATVVTKLLNLVQPRWLFLGEKDYQQVLIISRVVADLSLPVEIVTVPTVREPDGLALSSRNAYLDADERRRAPALYAALQTAAIQLEDADADITNIERQGQMTLQTAGLRPDYFAVRRAQDLSLPAGTDEDLIVLGAAWAGRTRLIDNQRARL